MKESISAFSLAGKRLLVTGGSSGIGSQIAISCANAGAKVALLGRDGRRLLETHSKLYGNAHDCFVCDLKDQNAVEATVTSLGKIDGVVHAAGISMLSPVRLLTATHIDAQLSTNVVGPMLLMKHLLSRNAIIQGGSVVFISSISAHIGVHGVATYSASKGAIEAMARCLALEVSKRKIRVNCIAPGFVETPMLKAALNTTGGLEETIKRYPLGLGVPEDIANAAIFFLSSASRWITGTTLVMDGGHTIG